MTKCVRADCKIRFPAKAGGRNSRGGRATTAETGAAAATAAACVPARLHARKVALRCARNSGLLIILIDNERTNDVIMIE